jgi:uncharacterized protein DUF932
MKMPAEVESMIFREEFGMPWHGLGKPITEKITAAQGLELAEADYEVVKAISMDVLPDGTEIPASSTSLYSDYGGTWNYLNTVKKADNYEIVQNREIAEMLDYGDNSTASLTELFDLDTLAVLSGSKRAFFCLRMGERSVKINGKDDKYMCHMGVINDFAGGNIFVTQSRTRIVCRNTMIAALEESDEDGTLWTISHRSNPRERLEFRIDLERVLQNSDDQYFTELELMVNRMWQDQEEKDKFVNMIFPDPKPSKNIRQARMVHPDMREAVVVPIMKLAQTDQKTLNNMTERAERNRAGLYERIAVYEDEFKAESLYAAYQGATDWICWSKERGDMARAGQSIITPTGERFKNLQRVTDASRHILNPKYKSKRRKQQLWLD